MFLEFPKNFLWGAATSAHQVEGGNFNDWSEWEKKNAERLARRAKSGWQSGKTCLPADRFPETFQPDNYISGKACDHYNLFEKDFDIAKELGHNAHRFSIEWSRIEPQKGKFEKDQLAHYKAVIHSLKARGLEPFVTLWHWTLPLWLAKEGGVLNKNFPRYFLRYAEFVVNGLKDDVKFWVTLNEPTAVIGAGYFSGKFPPQKRSFLAALGAYKNLAAAHNAAYEKIHFWSPKSQVGLAHALKIIEPRNKKSPVDRMLARVGEYYENEKMFKLIVGKQDFAGVQYYYRKTIGLKKALPLLEEKVSDLGLEIYPDGLYRILKKIGELNIPVYITENGLADRDDLKREKFIRDHLAAAHRAISEGVDVRGYFHWSLLDNFEWDKGFWPRFGLVGIDYKMQKRTIRKSAYAYRDIIRGNGLELEIK